MMTDTDLKPLTDGDIAPAPATGDLQPDPVRDTAATDNAATGDVGGDAGIKARTTEAKQAIRDGAGKVTQQAGDKLRAYADDGKERAGSALEGLSQLLTDAAQQVDDKLGAQYGDYARNAAGQVQGFAETVRNKDIDDLIADARGFVKASPGVAIGIAAALGFVVARLVQSGVDSQD